MTAKQTIQAFIATSEILIRQGDVVPGTGPMTIQEGRLIGYCPDRFKALKRRLAQLNTRPDA